MPAAIVNIETFSDADFARAFQWTIDGVPFDFENHALMMMVRRLPEDAEVFVSLDSGAGGGIAFSSEFTTFTVSILRDQMIGMVPGEYVHSLILVRPDGLHEDIWRGTLTHAIGPTR